MKPLYSRHHRDLNWEVFPKLAYFTSKTFSRVFWYSVIESKVCQKVGVGRRKSLKTIY